MLRVVFMGSDRFSLPILCGLIGPDSTSLGALQVCAVVTQPDRAGGRGRRVLANPVKAHAIESGIQVLQFDSIRDRAALEEIIALEPDLLVVASFGQILPRRLLEVPRHKCLNLHPSLLPRYRGSSPVVTSILDGADVTGATLMVMTSKMDAGPIVKQVKTPIDGEETGGALTDRLANLSATLLADAFPDWIAGRCVPVPQNEEDATYTVRISKEDGLIDWTSGAPKIALRVRAFNPWPSAYTYWDGRLLRILRAQAIEGQQPPGLCAPSADGAVCVGTGNGLLSIHELQVAGGKQLAIREFVSGRPEFQRAQLRGRV